MRIFYAILTSGLAGIAFGILMLILSSSLAIAITTGLLIGLAGLMMIKVELDLDKDLIEFRNIENKFDKR